MLIAYRGTEKLKDALHFIPDSGGTVYGSMTVNGTITTQGNKVLSAADKGLANGVASLGDNAKVPAAQIPVASASSVGGVKLSFEEETGTLNIMTE